MGTYKLIAQEIANRLDSIGFEIGLEGDFTEQDFIKAASLYCDMLRERGAYIPNGSGEHDCEECGRSVKKEGMCDKCKKKAKK